MRSAVFKTLGFAMSALVAYFILFWSFFLLGSFIPPRTEYSVSETQMESFSGSTVATTAALAAFFSLIASVFSLMGFLSGTILAWRKEKREALSYEIDRAKKELEIAKLRLDLENLSAKRGAEASASSTTFSDSGEYARGTLASASEEAPNTVPQADGSAAA